jgi:phosphoenolpyruvate carboxykinase (ATP)
LRTASTQADPIFGLEAVTEVPGVPSEILIPEQTWADKAAYRATATKLANLFVENFKTYETGTSAGIKAAGPKI